MRETDDAKAEARSRAFARRKSARANTGARPDMATDQLVKALRDVIVNDTTGPIAGYMPIRTEIDPIPAMTALCDSGHEICVPVVGEAGLPLRFRIWSPEATMIPGPFGAQVPERGAWVDPIVLIVPLVAFTLSCQRLGYGGGFYDRTLARLRQARTTRAIGFAYDGQRDDDLPIGEFDEPLDMIVTERRIYRRIG